MATSLLAAAWKGHSEVVTLLCDRKANIDAANNVMKLTYTYKLLFIYTYKTHTSDYVFEWDISQQFRLIMIFEVM